MRAHPFVAAAIVGTSLILVQRSMAVTVPFSENFDSYPIGTANPTNFTQTSGNLYSIVAGSGAGENDYRAALSSTGGLSSSAAASFPGLAGSAFTVSTEFTIDSFTAPSGSTLNLGFGILGNSGNFSTGTQYRILFTLAATNTGTNPGAPGTINIQEGTGSGATTLTGQTIVNPIPILTGVLYSLSVSGAYSPTGALTLVATAKNLTSGATTTTTVTDPTPVAGDFFGYRTAINGNEQPTSETIRYDNFSVVPEPSTALALLSGAGLLMLRRRRLA